jgi:hypothetical protein
MSINATVENDTIKLPVHLPDGTPVRIDPVPESFPAAWPPDYFRRTAGMLAGERFERPEQGDVEQREKW